MPLNITDATPRNQRTIGGIVVNVPAPYTEGHVVTAGEAAMLNQTLAENFSNNLRTKVEKFIPAGSPEGTAARVATAEEAQGLVDSYASTYEPGVRRAGSGGGRASLDPIEKEMRVIARESLNNLLKKQGLKRNEVSYDDLLEDVLRDHADALRSKAEKIVAARSKNTLDDLDISLIEGAGNASEEPADAELETAE
jgi:hypothetical protein